MKIASQGRMSKPASRIVSSRHTQFKHQRHADGCPIGSWMRQELIGATSEKPAGLAEQKLNSVNDC